MQFVRTAYRSQPVRKLTISLASVYRKLLQARAKDYTALSDLNECLVLAPHPDDETLGCGITIMRKRAAGRTVWVVIATDGRHSHHSELISADELAEIRRREAISAGHELGLEKESILFLDFEDQSLLENLPSLTDQLRRLIGQLAPREIFIPSAIDGNPDHRALNSAALIAIRDSGMNISVFEYPIWFWDVKAWIDRNAKPWQMAWQILTRPVATFFTLKPVIVRSDNYAARKEKAFAAHRSQSSNITGERNWATIDRNTLNLLIAKNELFFEKELTAQSNAEDAIR